MTATFYVDENKGISYSLKFDEADKISGRQGLVLIARHIIDSLGNN